MSHARIAVVVTLFASSLALVPATPPTAASPINVNNRPTPLAGQTNGVVAPQLLVNVGPNCIASRAAAPSLARIFTMARQSTLPLGAEECYRTLQYEVIYANRANQPGNNPACVASVKRAPNGAPIGTSYHGWGKAVDLSDRAASSLALRRPRLPRT